MHLWTEVCDAHADVIKYVIAHRSSVNREAHLCARRQRKGEGCNFRDRMLDGIRSAAPSTPDQSGWSGSSLTAPTIIQGQQTRSTGQVPQAGTSQQSSKPHRTVTIQQQAPQIGIQMPAASGAVVFFGVQGSRRTLELAQIDTSQHSEDSLFFASMKREYRALRGKLRYWLSIWRLSHCDFVKVNPKSPKMNVRLQTIVREVQSQPDRVSR